MARHAISMEEEEEHEDVQKAIRILDRLIAANHHRRVSAGNSSRKPESSRSRADSCHQPPAGIRTSTVASRCSAGAQPGSSRDSVSSTYSQPGGCSKDYVSFYSSQQPGSSRDSGSFYRYA